MLGRERITTNTPTVSIASGEVTVLPSAVVVREGQESKGVISTPAHPTPETPRHTSHKLRNMVVSGVLGPATGVLLVGVTTLIEKS